jgi:hypothetical protein
MVIARRVIKAKDIQNFFGKGTRMSFKMMKSLREEYKKKPHQPITMDEFCNYYGVKETDLMASISAGIENDKGNNIKKNGKQPIDEVTQATFLGKDTKGMDKIESYQFSKRNF